MADKIAALVVGAGPVGLTMAAELRRYGVELRIIDKSATRTDKSKALVVWTRSLELIERMGCVDRFLASGMPVHGARISNGTDLIGDITFDDVDSPYPFALMIPQSDTERLLEERLEQFGTTVVDSYSVERSAVGDLVLRNATALTDASKSARFLHC